MKATGHHPLHLIRLGYSWEEIAELNAAYGLAIREENRLNSVTMDK